MQPKAQKKAQKPKAQTNAQKSTSQPTPMCLQELAPRCGKPHDSNLYYEKKQNRFVGQYLTPDGFEFTAESKEKHAQDTSSRKHGGQSDSEGSNL